MTFFLQTADVIEHPPIKKRFDIVRAHALLSEYLILVFRAANPHAVQSTISAWRLLALALFRSSQSKVVSGCLPAALHAGTTGMSRIIDGVIG